jgi:hypothetical protein
VRGLDQHAPAVGRVTNHRQYDAHVMCSWHVMCIVLSVSVYIDGNALDTILTALNKCNIDFPHEYRRG